MSSATQTYHNNIHLVLRDLIDRKTKRDQKNFTIYQLAKAINVPHSILVKLMHADPTKRVCNPRIDTLSKIIDFFRNDGFDIAIDDLLSGIKSNPIIDVPSQSANAFSEIKSIPIYQISAGIKNNIGTIETKLTSSSGNFIALLSDEDIKPMFKKGSIFIVDTLATPENDTLVAVELDDYNRILIRKFYIKKNKKILASYDENILPIELTKKEKYRFIGVVVQVNAKT
ncbi:MAG: hypothetical protein A3F11_06980 [Gammaproteobacteria bacterium RIFCSPHIGHO2_12_FULL_37_14]|nr:MAG: hypothetical protein A3F11_06980 [Gammaproteobacteria bacterium RIFCSPHIGHO2_12_FULL_37_14]